MYSLTSNTYLKDCMWKDILGTSIVSYVVNLSKHCLYLYRSTQVATYDHVGTCIRHACMEYVCFHSLCNSDYM